MTRRKRTRADLPTTTGTEVIAGYTLETLSDGRCRVLNYRMFLLKTYKDVEAARKAVNRVVRKYQIERERRQLNFQLK